MSSRLTQTLVSIVAAAVAVAVAATAHAERLTIERLFTDPALTGVSPRALEYAPDGSRVTFLKPRVDDSERYDLWEYHIADDKTRMLVDSEALVDGEEALSDEEKARRERQRIYGSGIMEYVWAEDARSLLFPLAGDVYRYGLRSGDVDRITETEAFETDVRSSPRGRYVSFVRDQDIYAVDLIQGGEKRLTQDGGGPIKNGMAEFVAQEEMDRLTGYWWSPDERHVAFIQVDESTVDLVTRSEIYADRIAMTEQRYPAAGRPNVRLRLGIVDVQSLELRWIELGDNPDIYLPRVDWANASQLSYQLQSRDQQRLELRVFELDAGRSRALLREESETWVNLHEDLHFMEGDDRFVWSSERSGYRHLYLYSLSRGLERQLTSGDWSVDALAGVDEKRGLVYFTGRKGTPLERHLYRVPLERVGEPERITSRDGMHAITLAPDAASYLDRFSDPLTPTQISLHAADGESLAWVEENAVREGHPLYLYHDELLQPEFGILESPSGQTLHYRLYRPADFEEGRRYPVVQYVYGGPGAQVVSNGWDRLFHQYLAQQGYVVFSVDNRGSAHRGKAFEDPIYKRMGQPEVADQVAGVQFLRGLSFVDPDRIAIYGHSYGGYMALMCLMQAGEYFAAGVSGAPVTDWALYDTHYTERYMGMPQAVAESYTASSVFPYVENLEDPLLLYHGMADDNVLFTNSTRFMSALQDAGKQFELMTYPGKKHGIRGKDTRVHLYTLISGFFDRHLKDG
jgi:dipeptidyl-peptidase-4